VAAQKALTKHAWPDGASLGVRVGLDTGEPVGETEGYVGLDLHRAARVCSTGHGGQILLSDAVNGLAGPPGVSLRDFGTHRLKDLKVRKAAPITYNVVVAETSVEPVARCESTT
jgi:class 3 adenylate cyclase